LISALTLIALNYAVAWVTFKFKKAESLIDGQPELLIHNSIIYEDVLGQQLISRHELEAAIRQAGCTSFKEVHFAFLETNGSITVKKK
jgi:uncharacterized membrane protein YcaP (DUF421 family)